MEQENQRRKEKQKQTVIPQTMPQLPTDQFAGSMDQLNQLQSSRLKQKQMTEDQKEEVTELVEEKFDNFQREVQGMVNNFQIEIIRQFEI